MFPFLPATLILSLVPPHIKTFIFSNLVIYRFKAISIKIPRKFFTDFYKSTLYGKSKKNRIAKKPYTIKVFPEAVQSLRSSSITKL